MASLIEAVKRMAKVDDITSAKDEAPPGMRSLARAFRAARGAHARLGHAQPEAGALMGVSGKQPIPTCLPAVPSVPDGRGD